jgi:3-oxoacyl-[acyl-carrier protein] reductase
MLLESKNAIVYGGAGSIGGAVARAFAREGATVHLAGRTQATLDEVAEEVRSAGGRAETAVVDAYDEQAVDAHADAVAGEFGSVDISMNVISQRSVHGTPMADMALADFTDEISQMVTTQFLTTRAAARHMRKQGSGVLLFFGGSGDPLRNYYIGGTQVGFEAVEAMRQQIATEHGGEGIRTVTLRTGGIPESMPEFEGRERIVDDTILAMTLLGRAATLADVGNVAAFVASDQARTMTAATVNVSCGALID